MKRTKEQKAITLIALIITIVVLLILAAVAISSISNDGILSYATNAVQNYNQAVKNEQDMLNEYIGYLKGIGKAVVGTKVKKLSTINGQPYTAYNPVIPEGFMPINTATSTWEATNLEEEVKKGLVISDGTSEFVWIPVADISNFARLQEGSDTNYRGVLYDWRIDTTGSTEYVWPTNDTSFSEPKNLTCDNYADTKDKFTIIDWNENYYQNAFNDMVKSVAKYNGFYVGRYETSFNGSSAQSRSGATPMNERTWFQMYENSKTYSLSNTDLGVVSEMIWGCQWDAMLKHILTGTEADHVTSTSNVGHDISKVYKTGGTNYTGSSVQYNDIASNIFDLEGNVTEWTQAGYPEACRQLRGGNINTAYSLAHHYPEASTYSNPNQGTRLSLYVKI